jgi:hypothetical protein
MEWTTKHCLSKLSNFSIAKLRMIVAEGTQYTSDTTTPLNQQAAVKKAGTITNPCHSIAMLG